MSKTKSLVDKKIINSALRGIISRLEKTEKFALDQAPDICKQMVTNGILNALEQALGASLLVSTGLTAFIYAWLHDLFVVNGGEYHTGDPTRYFFEMLFGGIAFAIGFFMALDSAFNIIYLKRCTKLFLLREFKKLVK